MAQLQESTPKIGRGELRRFLSRIKFVEAPYEVSGCRNIVPLEGLGQILPIPALSLESRQNGELSRVLCIKTVVLDQHCFLWMPSDHEEMILSCF